MTEERPRVWVGDQVWDDDAGREGIVTDVQGGMYIIGPVYMWAATWTATGDEKLEVVLSREERAERQREQGW